MLKIKASQLFLFFFIKLARCDILVYNMDTHEIEIEFKDVPSKFGDPIPPDGITGLVVYANPPDACKPIEKPPSFYNYTGKWFVLIKRYGCQFENKVRNAQKAGYDAAIVHNVDSSVLKPMAADTPTGIHIPSVFIGSESGLFIKNNYLYNKGYFVLITDDIPFNFTSRLLIIFSVLIGLCFFVMIFYLVVKYFKDRRRRQRNCLPKSSLREIPIHKFKKSDPYEVCAICLEDYVENDKLRVLPCSHAYHSKCIDPWLTKNRRVCPVCKRRVLCNREAAGGSDVDADTEDERTPLVRDTNPINAGTFTRPRNDPTRSRFYSDSDSISLPSSVPSYSDSRSDSFRSLPEAEDVEVRDLPHIYSINSGEPTAPRPTPERSNRSRSSRWLQTTRVNIERC